MINYGRPGGGGRVSRSRGFSLCSRFARVGCPLVAMNIPLGDCASKTLTVAICVRMLNERDMGWEKNT